MSRGWIAVAAGALAACGGTPELEFIAEYEVLYCEGYVICASDEMLRAVDERECHEYLRSSTYPDSPDCRYDRVAAEECLDQLSTAGCVDNDPELPVRCADVWSNCQYPIIPREDGSTVIGG